MQLFFTQVDSDHKKKNIFVLHVNFQYTLEKSLVFPTQCWVIYKYLGLVVWV